ncbi:isoflavone reductase [Plectosphaerella plurivora]|uniref:Isoflavone reductase n=1 Tax=Plectosphaerella plurivora TaxID=936078 RepID=A0A9P9A9G8_9PEZI|nr:isoflavone reductase [Plectosphaerella plurivora]
MKVTIVGASGETGKSIVNGLLASSENFEITALARESSINGPRYQALKELGVTVAAVDLAGSEEDLTKALAGAEVVICTLHVFDARDQINLASAAKKAGVKRFVPSFFATVAPPSNGVLSLRGEKEKVLNHIKEIYLPYTSIDVGWWYQITPPRLPSGRIDKFILMPPQGLVGEGNVPSAYTDNRDIGRYVAKIITDPRTLNKAVFAYSEVLTHRQIWGAVERASGEKLEYNYIPVETIETQRAEARKAAAADPGNMGAVMALAGADYGYSMNVRGDNAPEYAKYLGYLDAKELYPDLEFIKFDDFLAELIEGKVKRVYADNPMFGGK